MARKTKQSGCLLAVRALLCAALAGATVHARAQADPACYVVNQVLFWLKPASPAVECAAARATSAASARQAAGTAAPSAPAAAATSSQAPRTPATAAAHAAHSTLRRPP